MKTGGDKYMLKNYFKKAVLLATTILVFSSGITVFAENNSNSKAAKNPNAITNGVHKGKKCHGIHSILEKQIGLTKEDIDAAKKSGKTVFDLAKEKKGLTPDQVRNIIITEKNKCIDKAVSNGRITKEKGTEIKAKVKEKITKWDGSFKKR